MNNFLVLNYTLFEVNETGENQIEQTAPERPMVFISGLGLTLPKFEENVAAAQTGDSFDFTLMPEDAYGPHLSDRVLVLGKEVFSRDGVFDEEHVTVGAIIPLQNENGQQYISTVVAVGENDVTVDLNHPLAGKTLHFKGNVIENHEATEEEVKEFIQSIHGGCGGGCHGNCGGNCGDCGGDCNCGDGDCNCGDGECNCGGNCK